MVLINSTEFGSITIDGKIYYTDVIVSWDGEIKEARTFARHFFDSNEFEQLMRKNPEVIVIGTGDSGYLKVSDEARKLCKQRNVEIIDIVSKKAIEKVNENLKRGKRVIGFIHITC
jgi:hypothetical protein